MVFNCGYMILFALTYFDLFGSELAFLACNVLRVSLQFRQINLQKKDQETMRLWKGRRSEKQPTIPFGWSAMGCVAP